MVKGLVSVIIPNHNRDIGELLEALKKSSYKNIEILEINLGLERSAQRNIGIARANGEYLLFLDSDQAVSPDLISECVILCSVANAIYIPEKIQASGIFGAIRIWERGFYNGTAVDVVRFIRAKNCPRFDESLSGPEDSDWDRRVLGIKLISVSPLYHHDNISFLTYFKKKAYYAESMARFAKKWPTDKVLNWKWRCFWVFIENKKWKRFLSRPDMALAVLTIIFIRGIIYYAKR